MRTFKIITLCLSPLVVYANTAQNVSRTINLPNICQKQYESGQYSEAFQTCMSSAQKNDPLSQYLVGIMYQRARGTQANQTKALEWFSKAAEHHHAKALVELGKMYSIGALTETDPVKTIQYFTQAAEQNDPQAQYLLALCFQNGIGVTKDYTSAIYWYNQASKNGLVEAKAIDADSIRTYEPIKVSEWPGFYEYKLSLKDETLDSLTLAAEKGHPQAQYLLGMKYIHGENIEQDDAMGLAWLEKAALKQHQGAQSQLAWMTILGIGTRSDISKSIKWFLQARMVNTSYPAELVELSEIDTEEVLSSALIQPQDTLAQYSRGVDIVEGTTQGHLQQGIDLIENAAIDNQIAAQLYLAKLYQSGDKIAQNKALAAKWFTRAAQNGNIEAQYTLGWLYVNGEGVQRDYTKAFEWFDRASKLGNKAALDAKKFVSNQLKPMPIQKAPQRGILAHIAERLAKK